MKRAEARPVFSTTVHVPITGTRTKRIQSRHKIPRSTQLYVKLDVSGILILLGFFPQITSPWQPLVRDKLLEDGKT